MEREQINFKDFQLFVGLDVHKRQWSVSIYTSLAHHRTFSQPPYPKALKSYLDKLFQELQLNALMKLQSLVIGSFENLRHSVMNVLSSMQLTFQLPIKNPPKKQIQVIVGKLVRHYELAYSPVSISPSNTQNAIGNCSGIANDFGQIWSESRTG